MDSIAVFRNGDVRCSNGAVVPLPHSFDAFLRSAEAALSLPPGTAEAAWTLIGERITDMSDLLMCGCVVVTSGEPCLARIERSPTPDPQQQLQQQQLQQQQTQAHPSSSAGLPHYLPGHSNVNMHGGYPDTFFGPQDARSADRSGSDCDSGGGGVVDSIRALRRLSDAVRAVPLPGSRAIPVRSGGLDGQGSVIHVSTWEPFLSPRSLDFGSSRYTGALDSTGGAREPPQNVPSSYVVNAQIPISSTARVGTAAHTASHRAYSPRAERRVSIAPSPPRSRRARAPGDDGGAMPERTPSPPRSRRARAPGDDGGAMPERTPSSSDQRTGSTSVEAHMRDLLEGVCSPELHGFGDSRRGQLAPSRTPPDLGPWEPSAAPADPISVGGPSVQRPGRLPRASPTRPSFAVPAAAPRASPTRPSFAVPAAAPRASPTRPFRGVPSIHAISGLEPTEPVSIAGAPTISYPLLGVNCTTDRTAVIVGGPAPQKEPPTPPLHQPRKPPSDLPPPSEALPRGAHRHFNSTAAPSQASAPPAHLFKSTSSGASVAHPSSQFTPLVAHHAAVSTNTSSVLATHHVRSSPPATHVMSPSTTGSHHISLAHASHAADHTGVHAHRLDPSERLGAPSAHSSHTVKYQHQHGSSDNSISFSAGNAKFVVNPIINGVCAAPAHVTPSSTSTHVPAGHIHTHAASHHSVPAVISLRYA